MRSVPGRSVTWGLVAAGSLIIASSAIAQSPDAGQPPQAASRPAPGLPPGASQPATGIGPRLELHPRDFRFGEVWQGLPAEREFTVKNTGDSPLTVVVSSTCGCAVVTAPKSPLAPGESSTFKISYQTGAPGPSDRRVTVTTNEAHGAIVEIPVQGLVKPLYDIAPSNHISFQRLNVDSRETQSVRIVSKYDKPLNFRIKSGQESAAFEIVLNEVEPGREFHLVATTKPPLQPGWNNAAVLIETGLPDCAPLTVSLSAQVPPRVVVQPGQLAVTPQFTRPMQQTVHLEYRSSEPLVIKDITCDLPSVRFELLPPSDLPERDGFDCQEIRVTLPSFADLPAEGGTLVIHTDDEGEFATLTVPIERRMPPARRTVRPPVPPASQPAGTPQ